MKIGYFLPSEEHPPNTLVRHAKQAEDAGFEALWISDHFHPWNDEQGESPLVWSVIGGISQVTSLPVTTAVTCPTVRIHPVIIAQAAATSSLMLDGNFLLGVGSGEALNEHITGAPWPNASVRLAMLKEAVEVIRLMFDHDVVSFDGRFYTVNDARLYSRGEGRVPILVSGFGPKAIELAAEIGDGFITMAPSADDVKSYKYNGGKGPVQGGTKVCWAPTADQAARTAHRLWANMLLPGELAQVLPSPRHFEQASQLTTVDQMKEKLVCGPDPARHIEHLRKYQEAGFDEVYVSQIGDDVDGFFDLYRREVIPTFG